MLVQVAMNAVLMRKGAIRDHFKDVVEHVPDEIGPKQGLLLGVSPLTMRLNQGSGRVVG